MNNLLRFTLTLLLILSFAIMTNAGEGNADIKIGYISTDEEGNGSVNQETFNVDEGVALSITDFNYILNNGVILNADLINTTLDNRNLRLSGNKPGLFSFSAYNNSYIRNFNYEKTLKTTRDSYGFQSSIIATKNIRFFGGYALTDKEGTNLQQIDIYNDTTLFTTDYRQTTYRFGAHGFTSHGNVRVEYRKSDFEDKTINQFDRESEQITLSAFTIVPKVKTVHLSGGYVYRTDKETTFDSEIKTNQLWGATKYYFHSTNSIEYRIKFARSDNNTRAFETDNWVNSLTYGKTWRNSGGVRVGVESRIVDDLTDRSESNILRIDGWLKVNPQLLLRAKISTKSKDIPTGSTLIGDESMTRHLLSARYTHNQYGDLTLRLDKRIRKNEDAGVNTQIDYTSATSILNFTLKDYGLLNVTYSYYLGEYENRDFIEDSYKSYEFSDHVVTGTLTPRSFGNIDVSVGGTYYRSRRDHNKEKFSVNLGAKYMLPHDHIIEIKYDAFNYDDYQLNSNYYTANIIEINFIKAIQL